MRRISVCALPVALLILAACAGQPRPAPQTLTQADITVGRLKLSVEVARTETQRRIGMMHRTTIKENQGMLFVFAEPRVLSFYMKDTHVPLSIAFIRTDGVIDRIAQMAPLSLQTHESNSLCLYALEMPQGWFRKHGIRNGMKVNIPATVTAQD